MSIHSELWDSYRAAFDYFNKELFEGKLPSCVLTLNARGNSTSYFKPGMWQREGNDLHHEISLNPSMLNRADDFMFQNLVRCMVFLWQETNGTLGGIGYCSDEFTQKMRDLGLPCEKSYGMNVKWSVDQNGQYATIRPVAMKNFFPLKSLELPAAKSKRVKFTCSNCGTKAMAMPGVRLVCQTEECNTEMTKEISED